MSRSLQISIGLLAILAVFIGFWLTDDKTGANALGNPSPERTVVVDMIQVEKAGMADRVVAVGTTRAQQAIDLVPLATGRVEAVLFVPGQEVEKGAPLIHLDRESEEAQVMEANAALDHAGNALARAQQLAKSDRIAQASVEELQADFLAAQARLKAADKILAERTVVAPFTGKIGFTEIDVGGRVSEGMVLTTLDDLSTMQVEFSLPERYYGVLAPEMSLTLKSVAFNEREFEGQIKDIDARIDPVTRSFRVRAEVPNPNGVLPTGMFVHVGISLADRDVISIPDQVVLAQGAESFVFVVREGRAVQTAVELGQRLGDRVEVLTGLREGDQIIAKGLHNLRDGTKVAQVSAQAGTDGSQSLDGVLGG
ncbi:MAG: efflux RND transporter periplasmic adaptor subunit [Pseudomonadota bacterium]